jgi:hypothetical protein
MVWGIFLAGGGRDCVEIFLPMACITWFVNILQVVVQVVLHLYQDFGVHILIMLSKDVSCSVFLLIDLSWPDVLYKGEVSL